MRERIYRILYVICWQWVGFKLKVQCRKLFAKRSKLMILPCDPWTVSGSRGDEAMITALVQDFKERNPHGEIVLVSAGNVDSNKIKTGRLADVKIMPVWRGRIPFLNIIRLLQDEAPSECCVLGADCMDGHYSVLTSLTLLIVADVSTRFGIDTRLTGFSFNKSPSKMMVVCFKRTTPQLRFRLRDPVSLQRFCEKTKCQAELVADVAFLLRPTATPQTQSYEQWIRQEHDYGQKVLGFNVHGLLVADMPDKTEFLNEIGRRLGVFLEKRPAMSCLLMPHDFRFGGDLECLLPIYNALTRFGERVSIIREDLSAAELKEICGVLDGVFASRMHLGIAALGMGKPVAGFGYQGKFSGLFQHFDCSPKWILGRADSKYLSDRLMDFVLSWPKLTGLIEKRKPSILALARKNLPNQQG